MKPTHNFKLTKRTKTILATIINDADRNAFKANMIQAQLASEQRPVKEKK